MRWCCSATLARFRKWAKARASGVADSTGSCERSDASSLTSARETLDSIRTRSTVSKRPGPPCVWSVSPRSLPSSRTSSRNGLWGSSPAIEEVEECDRFTADRCFQGRFQIGQPLGRMGCGDGNTRSTRLGKLRRTHSTDVEQQRWNAGASKLREVLRGHLGRHLDHLLSPHCLLERSGHPPGQRGIVDDHVP